MIHGMTHFDSSGEAVTYEPADFGFKNVQQIAVGGEIFRCAMDCGSELTLQLFSGGKHLAF